VPGLALSRVGARAVELVDSETEGAGQGLAEDAWARLERVDDPRSVLGRVYPLSCLLAIAVCALTAAGHDRLTAVGQWIARAGQDDLARLRAPYDFLAGAYRVPDEKTIRSVLERIDPLQLTRALLGPRRRVRTAADGSPSRKVRAYRARRAKRAAVVAARPLLTGVAVDGKTSRGARRANGSRVHLLGLCEHGSTGGRFLDQVEVDVKHNEVSHFKALLQRQDLCGRVVTFDALLTVRTNLDWLVTIKRAHYIAVVKKNQPLLYRRLKSLPWKQVRSGAATRETGHGRIETRTVKAVHVDDLDFPHARQAIKITRWRQNQVTAKISRETIYLITDLTSSEATAADLARLAREQWTIEAQHHVRDVSFGEDHCTSRTGNGPINLATIRAAVINAIQDAGYLHIPEGRRDHTTAAEALYLHGLT
jgi:predicted transposase YbfD/YdcC